MDLPQGIPLLHCPAADLRPGNSVPSESEMNIFLLKGQPWGSFSPVVAFVPWCKALSWDPCQCYCPPCRAVFVSLSCHAGHSLHFTLSSQEQVTESPSQVVPSLPWGALRLHGLQGFSPLRQAIALRHKRERSSLHQFITLCFFLSHPVVLQTILFSCRILTFMAEIKRWF